MILTLALRNLFHDRIRLAVTLIGILFSIVLVAVQLGLYLGSSRMITANIDKANTDLWVTTFGAKSNTLLTTLGWQKDGRDSLLVTTKGSLRRAVLEVSLPGSTATWRSTVKSVSPNPTATRTCRSSITSMREVSVRCADLIPGPWARWIPRSTKRSAAISA